MSYMSRLFPRSNSSFKLSSGCALKAQVTRISEDRFVVDAGLGSPRICKQDELTGVPSNQTTMFETKVGYEDRKAGESKIKKMILERFFVDMVAGGPKMKERAAAKFDDVIGSTDVGVAGEPHLVLPRRFRQNRAWMELNKRVHTKVKGFIVEKARGGYLVAIAGFITFLPFHTLRGRRIWNDRFTIESINPKRTSIVVS